MRELFKSKINDEFNGWDEGNLFKLDNGRIYIQDEYKYKYKYKYRPSVVVYESNGKIFLKVDCMDEAIKVRPIENFIESRIDGDFEGWDGNTKFKLMNGQVWEQVSYNYHYYYAYMPEVMIYNDGYSMKMKVKGITNSIQVRRLI